MSKTENTHTRHTTDARFEAEVLGTPGLSMVDFWAEWCGPCKTLSPTIDSLANEHAGSLNVFKLDVDSNPETATRYHIRGIPTVLFFKNGKLVDQLVGAHPKEILAQTIARHQGA